MAVIRIDPAQVTSTGNQFTAKSTELSSLVQQARGLMNSLQGQFTGQRASMIFSEWEQMQPSLQNAIQTLSMAGDLLKRASIDFQSADSAR